MSATSHSAKISLSQHIHNMQHLVTWEMEQLFRKIFAMTQVGGIARNLAFLCVPMAIWVLIAILRQPFQVSALQGLIHSFGQVIFFFKYSPPLDALGEGLLKVGVYILVLFAELVGGMLRADLLRHVLTILLPFFMAYELAALYLADIFEPNRFSVAFRFLWQTAFSLNYPSITIENGRVSEKDQDSPMLFIGGPGNVHVNLENVAVFEKPNGQVRIIGQHTKENTPYTVIDGFERLREIIDLRNHITQTNELTIEGRTRDGIRLIAQNVRIDFSLLRDLTVDPTELAINPYPYQEEAVKALVFNRYAKSSWPSVMKGMVVRNLQEFIAEHKLSEFLAASDLPEGDPKAHHLTFIPRREISQSFIASRFSENAARLGLQLNWIDIGTWVAPGSAYSITDKHLDAWKITCENELRQKNIETIAKKSRLEELSQLIKDVPLAAHREEPSHAMSDSDKKMELLSFYLNLLRKTQDDLIDHAHEPNPDLDEAIQLLKNLIKKYQDDTGQARWLG